MHAVGDILRVGGRRARSKVAGVSLGEMGEKEEEEEEEEDDDDYDDGWMDGRMRLGSNLCSEPPFCLRDRIVLQQGFLSKERVLFASPAHGTHRPGMG